MKPVRSEIAQLQGCFGTQTFFDRSAPLLDVLWRRVQFESGKADGGRAQHGRREVEMTGDDAGGRSEVIALLSLGENVRDVVPLITPGIHVHRSKENSKGRVKHQAQAGNRL